MSPSSFEECAFAPHPLYPLPSVEDVARDYSKAKAYLDSRAQAIWLEQTDPWRYGYRPPVWDLVDRAFGELGKREVLILGGNRATKSYFAGHKVVEILLGGPKRTVWCLQTTYHNSVEMQQPIVYHYLPKELKEAPRTKITNISFSQKLGFSDGKFVCPNGSECIFRNYSQKISVIEGGNCDLIWCDELVPLDWIETLRYRLISKAGLLLLTFTPVNGWSPTVAEYLDHAKTLSFAPAPLLPRGWRGAVGTVPREQQPVRKNAYCIYFHITDNPFTSQKTVAETLDGAPREEILCRAYGIPTKSSTNRFPKFNDRLHVIKDELIPKNGTRYHFVDPASGRNWFMLWVLVTEDGSHYIYREWPAWGSFIPGVGDPGEWALADGKRTDGRPGPAQVSYGWGIRKYLEECERLEEGEEISQRWIDSAFAKIPSQTADSSTTLLEECTALGLYFTPAPHDLIDEGVSLVNNLLDYERGEDDQVKVRPKLFFSESCRNLIFCLKLWNGKDGRMGASKDPIDCLRYMACARLVAYTESDLNLYSGGAY